MLPVGAHREQFGECDVAGDQALRQLGEPVGGLQPALRLAAAVLHRQAGPAGGQDQQQGDEQPTDAELPGVPVGLLQCLREPDVTLLRRVGDVRTVRLGRHQAQPLAAGDQQFRFHAADLEQALAVTERAGHGGSRPQAVEDAPEPGE
ncbi:hypothetical protein [Kitasatospora fiedleri]|uniref:hypothetical protein n=1 Tax=Kitasatospora fiedleri TaxID=2991545 RepID=UPI00249BD0D3|nr:hypothetical protein [Kitasatospora fiedleri]